MDLRQLRYLVALNEHRSFVRGAEAMGITQPAFSRSIQGLEQELGCLLVERGHKELRPTPQGQVVLQHALSLLQGAARLSSEVARMGQLDAGELRFGCHPAALALVPEAVAGFIQAYPNVRTGFEVDNDEQLGRRLMREEIEFFVGDLRPFEADPNFQTLALTPRRSVFFCRPGHPLLTKDSLSTNDLFAYPLATAQLAPGTRKRLANLSGRTDFAPAIETEYFPALVDIVRRSDAIGLGSEVGFLEAGAQAPLMRLQWRNLATNIDSLHSHCAIVSRAGFRLSPAARAMVDRLVALDHQKPSGAS